MTRLNVDLRYAILATQGLVARRHAELALKRLGGTPGEVRRLVLSELEQSPYGDDEVERDTAFNEIYLLEGELPRLELYGIVFVLFAVFESVVKRLPKAKWLPAGESADSLGASRGDFISRASRYYRDELHVPLFNDPSTEEFVRMLADVRSAVAHANGDMAMLNANVERRIREQWVRKFKGLGIDNGHLVIAPELVLQAAHIVEESLRGIITRLKEAFPRKART